VELATVAATRVEDSVEVVGSLAAKFQSDVKSEYSGIVTEVYVTAWTSVRKGARLARLDPREVTTALDGARAALLQSEVAERRALREFERAGNLKEYGLVTQQQLDDARTAREAAEAATTLARAQVRAVQTRLEKTIVRAPMSGIVSFRGISVGDRVENMGSGQPMFTIVDPRLMEASLTVPSAHLGVLTPGQQLAFTVDGLEGRTFTGQIKFINPTVDPVTRAGTVQVDVANPEGVLRGGQFLRGRIVTCAREAVPHVPRSALLAWDVETQAADVFVVDGDRARRRRIGTGRVSGDLVEVTGGLAPGARVVSRGGFNLRDGDRITLPGREGD
jgi:RND family efflux transporter MFP subunit